MGVVTLAASVGGQDLITVVTNATVIEQPGQAPRRHDRMVFHGGTIRCIGSTRRCPVPDDASIIDGRGKWVMPGLIDAHVHMSGPEVADAGRLYLAFGITTVRDTGGHPDILRARLRSFDSGEQAGPRIFMAARSLDGDPLKWAGDKSVPRQVRTAEDVRTAIAEAKRDGASFIKLYGGLSRSLLIEGIREAHRQGLKATADILPVSIAAGADGVWVTVGFGP